MTDSSKGVDLFALIEDDRHRVSYRPSWNQFTGSVNATLLLQQIIYWWSKNKRRPFYKFNQPCDHPQCRIGDSWQEELGMSRSEFETARRKIAKKTTGGVNKKTLVSYWIDPDRRTWYAVNEAAVLAELQAIYPESDEVAAVGVQADLDLVQESSISPDPNAEIPHYVMQDSCNSYRRNPALELPQESCNRNTTKNTKEDLREDGREEPPTPFPFQPPPKTDLPEHRGPADQRVDAVLEVCGLDRTVPRHLRQAEDAAAQLKEYTATDIYSRYRLAENPVTWNWFADDWRGQRGSMPTPSQVVDHIAKQRTAVPVSSSGRASPAPAELSEAMQLPNTGKGW